jgi:hypothetical protein
MPPQIGKCVCKLYGFTQVRLDWDQSARQAYDGSSLDGNGQGVGTFYLTETIQYFWTSKQTGFAVSATVTNKVSRYFNGFDPELAKIETSCEGVIYKSQLLPQAGAVPTYYYNSSVYDNTHNCNIGGSGEASSDCVHCHDNGDGTSSVLINYTSPANATYMADDGSINQVNQTDPETIILSATQKKQRFVLDANGHYGWNGAYALYTLSDPITRDQIRQDAIDVLALFNIETSDYIPFPDGAGPAPNSVLTTSVKTDGHVSPPYFYFYASLTHGTYLDFTFGGRGGLGMSLSGNTFIDNQNPKEPLNSQGIKGLIAEDLWTGALLSCRLVKSKILARDVPQCFLFYEVIFDPTWFSGNGFLDINSNNFRYCGCAGNIGPASTTPAPTCLLAAGLNSKTVIGPLDVPTKGVIFVRDPGISGCPPPGGCC